MALPVLFIAVTIFVFIPSYFLVKKKQECRDYTENQTYKDIKKVV